MAEKCEESYNGKICNSGMHRVDFIIAIEMEKFEILELLALL